MITLIVLLLVNYIIKFATKAAVNNGELKGRP